MLTIIKWCLIGIFLYILLVTGTMVVAGYLKTIDAYQPTCCEEARKLPPQDH